MDYQFSYLNLIMIILPQLILLLLYFCERYCREISRGKILWVYNYNQTNTALKKYFIPFLSCLVYILGFAIPCFFRNVLGVLYLMFILARSYLSLKSRINLLSTILILLYFAFFITRHIWPNESLYISFILDPKTASFDFILAIVFVDLLHDLGSFIHMYIKLKDKNLRNIIKQSWIYREMILTVPKQSKFKYYYLKNYKRITNKNFKKIKSKFVQDFFENQVNLNSVYICGCDQNKLYGRNDNINYTTGQILKDLEKNIASRDSKKSRYAFWF